MNFDNIFNILNINNKIEYYNCNRLKNILDKGFKTGTINEIIGMPYTGKTKLIIDLINESCDEKIVLYITTNNNSNDLFNKYLENTDNVVLVFNNQEKYIRNIIKSIIKNVDMIIIDNISEIVTINESKDYSIKKRQNLENILQELYKLAYSNNKCIILVNSYIYKDDVLTPKYNNVMQSLCENRIEIKDNYELELKK